MSLPVVLALLAAFAAAGWLALLFHPAQPWRTRERLLAPPETAEPFDPATLTVLIPARDEAAHIGATIAALRAAGNGVKVIVIDDQSNDETAEIARRAGAEVIAGRPLPAGWTGKLWALEQGRRRVTTPLILQLDADIELRPGVLEALVEQQRQGCCLVSIMALLPVTNGIERWLLPPFVWFFKLLYPFAQANRPGRSAAAAGGCLLLERSALEQLGGYGALRGAVIDDCTLAQMIKQNGGRIWIGLSRDVISQRAAASLAAVKNLIARTAYTQLRHSPLSLVAATLLMGVMFGAPALGLALAPGWGRGFGAAAYGALFAAYQPMLRYYRLNPFWALSLPFAAAFYLAATWISARRHWRGAGAVWKGRTYSAPQTSRLAPLAAPGQVFIIGSPRSGTSVLHWSLLKHPDFWGSEESDFLIPLANALRQSYDFGTRFGEHAWLVKEQVDFNEFAAAVGKGIDALYAGRAGGRCWIDQTPAYTLIAEDLARMFPAARFLFIVRDGRKVVESMRRMWQWDTAQAARRWVEHNTAALSFEAAHPRRVMRIRYETLITEPAKELQEIFSFLSAADCPAAKNQIARNAPINTAPGCAQESRWDKLEIHPEQWPQNERAIFQTEAGEMMHILGYHDNTM